MNRDNFAYSNSNEFSLVFDSLLTSYTIGEEGQEAALCVRQLRVRGVLLATLLRVVQRFLRRHWYLYADSRSDT
jgi:hypothetical protein